MFVFYNYLQIKLSIDRNLCTMNGTMKTYSCLYHDNVLAILAIICRRSKGPVWSLVWCPRIGWKVEKLDIGGTTDLIKRPHPWVLGPYHHIFTSCGEHSQSQFLELTKVK